MGFVLKDFLIDYLEEHPLIYGEVGQYQKISDYIKKYYKLDVSVNAIQLCVRRNNLSPLIASSRAGISFNNRNTTSVKGKNNNYIGSVVVPTTDVKHTDETNDDGERILTVTGFIVPQTIGELINHYKIDLSIWKVENVSFTCWGNEKNPNKRASVTLRKIIPDDPKYPILKIVKPFMKFVRSQFMNSEQKRVKTSVIIADSQIGFRRDLGSNKLTPYHDRTAIDLTIGLIDYIQPDEVIILGDMLDISEGSAKFLKEPEFYFTTQSSITEMSFVLQRIRSVVNPECKVIYLSGNHETRLKNYAYENMAFAYTLKVPHKDYSIMSLRNLLCLDDLGIEFYENYPSDSYWINDNLRAVHGEYINLNKELANSRISTIQGHKHSIEKKFKTSHGRDGIEKMFVESVGCLCKIDGSVPGKSQPDWQQGILVVNTVDKYFDTHALVYHNGKTIYDNRVFTGRDYTPEIDVVLKNNV